jgi:hypothetical protein
MTHPLRTILTPEEFAALSRQVQLGEVSWPQCYEWGEDIHQMAEEMKEAVE